MPSSGTESYFCKDTRKLRMGHKPHLTYWPAGLINPPPGIMNVPGSVCGRQRTADGDPGEAGGAHTHTLTTDL